MAVKPNFGSLLKTFSQLVSLTTLLFSTPRRSFRELLTPLINCSIFHWEKKVKWKMRKGRGERQQKGRQEAEGNRHEKKTEGEMVPGIRIDLLHESTNSSLPSSFPPPRSH